MTLFDPATGKLVDREGLRSVTTVARGFRKPGTRITADGRRQTEVIHEGDGGTAAINTERGDGRVAVNAFPRPPDMGTAQ